MKPTFIGKAKITRQGQVTLPKQAREDLRLDSSREIYWYIVDDHLVATRDLLSLSELEKLLKKRGS